MKQQDTACADIFSLDEETYRHWRRQKLEAWANPVTSPLTIKSLITPGVKEIKAIKLRCLKTNICFYRTQQTPVSPSDIYVLGQQLGLNQPVANPQSNAQHISLIQETVLRLACHQSTSNAQHISLIQETDNSEYIPYSSRALNWHTDGYYNDSTQTIGSFILHCVRPAKEGGINRYIDPDIIYILLRDENPRHIRALMHPRTMTIPANNTAGSNRPAQSSPVFANDIHGNLLMRYTDRKRNIKWHEGCQQALSCLGEILSHNEKYQVVRQLKEGEGVICNNVLHDRSAFESDAENKRLLYRARYHRRLPGTGWQQLVNCHSQ